MTVNPTIAQYRTAYDKADSLAREVQEYRGEAAVPAQNQLRYAGYHLLNAISNIGEPANHDQLQKAINHCERAKYEACEAGIVYAVEEINKFKKDFKGTNIRGSLEDWPSILKLSRDASVLNVKFI